MSMFGHHNDYPGQSAIEAGYSPEQLDGPTYRAYQEWQARQGQAQSTAMLALEQRKQTALLERIAAALEYDEDASDLAPHH